MLRGGKEGSESGTDLGVKEVSNEAGRRIWKERKELDAVRRGQRKVGGILSMRAVIVRRAGNDTQDGGERELMLVAPNCLRQSYSTGETFFLTYMVGFDERA